MPRPDAILIGPKEGLHVEVSPAFGHEGLWSVAVGRGSRHGTAYSTIQPDIRDRDKALRLAEILVEFLTPEYEAEEQRHREWFERDEARRERERPKREAAARKRRAAVRKAPKIEVARCPACGHLEEDREEFEVPAYECGQDNTTGRGEDGRRCDQCGKFRAKASDRSCPSCEEPIDEVESVTAAQLPDGEIVSIEEEVR